MAYENGCAIGCDGMGLTIPKRVTGYGQINVVNNSGHFRRVSIYRYTSRGLQFVTMKPVPTGTVAFRGLPYGDYQVRSPLPGAFVTGQTRMRASLRSQKMTVYLAPVRIRAGSIARMQRGW